MTLLYRTIQSHIKDFENSLYTTVPAKVLEFDPEECTVKVQPSIDEVDFDGIVRVLPIQERVPLLFPNALDSALTFPVKVGDKVLLHFSQSNIEDFLLQSTQTEANSVTPRTKRKHDLDDAFATLGVRLYDDSPVKREDTLDLYYKQSRLTIEEDGTIELRHTLNNIDSYVVINPDGSLSLKNDKEGSKVELKADGNVNVTTKNTLSVNNSSIELISLLSDLINTLANTTVNTTYGLSPLNSKPQLQTLKTQLDTMKE